MNYKSFLRQQLCILVRGADGGRESVSYASKLRIIIDIAAIPP